MSHAPFDMKIVEDTDELALVGAQIFVDRAKSALKKKSYFTVVLSGGETPKPVYERLGKEDVFRGLPWEKVHFFWGDERNVPPDHPESNFHLAWTTMLSHLPIPAENIHRIRTELPTPQDTADNYEETLRSFFALNSSSDQPRFDLSFLGLGTDGHTASLFSDGRPNMSVSEEEPGRLVIAPWVAHLNEFRISITPTAVNESGLIIFLVSGKQKAPVLARLVAMEKEHQCVYPAQYIRPTRGRIVWLVDRAAAENLKW